MLRSLGINKSATTSAFDITEEIDIDKQVNAELNDAQCKMVRLSLLINPLVGGFVVGMLYKQANLSMLFGWYAALVAICIINFSWSYYYEYGKFDARRLIIWRRVYHLILAVLCLVWGSIAVLFVPDNLAYQLYIITFLQVALVAFNFGAMTDFVSTIINTVFMLIPFLSYHIYISLRAIETTGTDNNLNLAFSISLIILGSFLLLTTFIGSRVIRRFFTLIFENVALSKKLENNNKFLEERVKERTKELEKSLNLVTYQATHDLLTDLPNQRLLLEYLENDIRSANANTHGFAIVSFSLNEIEKINDGLGHQAGDLVVRTIAQRFQTALAKTNADITHKVRYKVTLSRKDVFVIVLDPIVKIEEIEKADILFKVVEEPVFTGSQSVKLTASIGVSLYPRDGKDIHTLLMNADAAMLRAKQQGGNNLHVYQAEINANISEQLEVERNLSNAVKNNELVLQYQPFVSSVTGKICGAEALVRWNSPELGLILPGNFIAVAEANGMIISIGEWVMRSAFQQAKEWHDQGYDSLRIAINLSAKQLYTKDILQTVLSILAETGATPAMLEFELTEAEAFQDTVIPILKQLKEMGFHLSIDDFGTGYSGFSNLKQFSINKLKIDQSFVRDLAVSEDSRAIVSNTIALGKKIEVTVLAEGVETKEQLQFLQEHHCDLIQGYYFSPPINASELTEMLKTKREFNINTTPNS